MSLLQLYRPPSLGLTLNSSLFSSYSVGLGHAFAPAAVDASSSVDSRESRRPAIQTDESGRQSCHFVESEHDDQSDESDIDVTDDHSSAPSPFEVEVACPPSKRHRQSDCEEGNVSLSASSEHSLTKSPATKEMKDDTGANKLQSKENGGEQPLDLSKPPRDDDTCSE